jgi:hypothetical protein
LQGLRRKVFGAKGKGIGPRLEGGKNMSFNYVRDLFLQYSVEKGDLVPMLEDCFEDMGGHTWHESNFTEDIVRDIVEGWSEDERSEFSRILRRGKV